MVTSKTSVSPYQSSWPHIPNKTKHHQHIREYMKRLQLPAISKLWLHTDTHMNQIIWPPELNYTWRFERLAMLRPVNNASAIDFSDSSPSNAEVKERVQPYLYSPSGTFWFVLGLNLPSSLPSSFRWNMALRHLGIRAAVTRCRTIKLSVSRWQQKIHSTERLYSKPVKVHPCTGTEALYRPYGPLGE